jgi:hypothetical protein
MERGMRTKKEDESREFVVAGRKNPRGKNEEAPRTKRIHTDMLSSLM